MRATLLSDAFAAVLKKHRAERKLSKAALAERAGLHQTYVGILERGEVNPTLDTMHNLAKALGYPLWKLIEEAEESLKQEKRTKISPKN